MCPTSWGVIPVAVPGPCMMWVGYSIPPVTRTGPGARATPVWRVKARGAVGVDFNFDATAADVIADLNAPLPFAESVFDEVRAIHVIEHLHDVMKAVSE